ncbi:LysR family transcriptional regulator [Bowmanella dokdonensis]|uniref:LysR family transcriptional regulator n=1 Tax=Bowmanella dokdonensis TaxID=751969 RepID=A0A939DRU4_9ALTE|nr:LysR family transcriptional regulator [Bowmanella dokdonensis]MBN7827630.1 LysR family transcriptional regulator [Bowmanella dokdonensis]
MTELPSLNAIRVFEAAARRGSFKAAAGELHLTPTAVSHQIRSLEDWFGFRLFERHTREVRLNQAGVALAEAASNSLKQLKSAVQALRQQDNRLVISCTSSFAALWLIPRLQSFHQQYPGPEIEVRSGETLEYSGEANCLPIRFGHSEGKARQQILHDESYGLFAAKGLAGKRLAKGQWPVFLTRWKNADLPPIPWKDWLAAHPGLPSLSEHFYDQELYGIQQALAGRGAVFCSSLLVAEYLHTGLLQAMGEPLAETALCYYLPQPETDLSELARLFTGWLRQQLKDDKVI